MIAIQVQPSPIFVDSCRKKTGFAEEEKAVAWVMSFISSCVPISGTQHVLAALACLLIIPETECKMDKEFYWSLFTYRAGTAFLTISCSEKRFDGDANVL